MTGPSAGPWVLGTPPAEFAVTEGLVRALLRDQVPDLAEAPLTFLDEGFDNAMWRVGEGAIARLPRRAVAEALLLREQRWLPELAPHLPLPVPAPLHLGRPALGYPWAWGLVPFVPGACADEAPLGEAAVGPWRAFLTALHQPAPEEAPTQGMRGGPLADWDHVVAPRLARLRAAGLLPEALAGLWARAVGLPVAEGRVWLHGDLHARNVLVAGGLPASVLDWGDLGAGDPAIDQASWWLLFDGPAARHAGVAGLGPEALLRAQARALSLGAVLLETGLVDHPRHAAMGRAVLRRLAEDQA